MINQPWYNSYLEAQQNYQELSMYMHIVQNYNVVCQAVVELTYRISLLQDKIMKMERNEEDRNVKKHVKNLHCKYCDDIFNENWKLELHLRSH